MRRAWPGWLSPVNPESGRGGNGQPEQGRSPEPISCQVTSGPGPAGRGGRPAFTPTVYAGTVESIRAAADLVTLPDRYRCCGGDSGGELTRDNFRLLPWTPAADRVRCRRMPPRSREHLMLGFSQVTRPHTSIGPARPATGTRTATTGP